MTHNHSQPMTEHTPLPWIAAAKHSSVVGLPIVGPMGQVIANTSIPGLPDEWPEHRKLRSEANAALIVEAVNNYESLKARVAELEDALKNMMGAFDTPLARRRLPPDDFMKECINSGRSALKGQPK